jgi:DNA-directed RNA polymerase subunit alpha
MSQNPMDMVIGASEAQRDAKQAARHVEAAKAAEAKGDRDLAIAELRKGVAADPSNTAALFDLAYRLDLSGEEDEALAMYERAGDRAPAPVNLLLNMAVIYEDREDYGRAERCLKQVLETSPNHPRAKMFMKDVLAGRDALTEDDSTKDLLKRRALLDTPVTDFELSVRARTCLKKMNIRSLGDLCASPRPN